MGGDACPQKSVLEQEGVGKGGQCHECHPLFKAVGRDWKGRGGSRRERAFRGKARKGKGGDMRGNGERKHEKRQRKKGKKGKKKKEQKKKRKNDTENRKKK